MKSKERPLRFTPTISCKHNYEIKSCRIRGDKSIVFGIQNQILKGAVYNVPNGNTLHTHVLAESHLSKRKAIMPHLVMQALL